MSQKSAEAWRASCQPAAAPAPAPTPSTCYLKLALYLALAPFVLAVLGAVGYANHWLPLPAAPTGQVAPTPIRQEPPAPGGQQAGDFYYSDSTTL